MEILERFSVGCVRGESLEALVIEERSPDVVRARLGDDVHDAAGGVPELRARAARDDLKLLHGFEGDVDGGPLAADLLAEETVRVVAAVEADVVEDAALAREGNLVAVGSLDYAHAGRQGQQVFEFTAQNRRL
jgi:hypothetical protein